MLEQAFEVAGVAGVEVKGSQLARSYSAVEDGVVGAKVVGADV